MRKLKLSKDNPIHEYVIEQMDLAKGIRATIEMLSGSWYEIERRAWKQAHKLISEEFKEGPEKDKSWSYNYLTRQFEERDLIK